VTAPAADLPSAVFRREREPSWRKLDRLLAQIDAGGIRRLSAGDLADLPHLYRTALSSLSIARATSLDRNLVAYLETLAIRGYFGVYGPPRRLRAVVASFLVRDFPAAARRFRWHVALAAGFLAIGFVTGWFAVARDHELYYSFVPEQLAGGRDFEASTDELRDTLYGGEGSAAFATRLFVHNARVGILCFALGFAAGVPVFLLMVQNGAILGAFCALFASRGLGFELAGWLLPHGVTELLAIVLCGGGGLVLAERLVLPGRATRLDALADGGRKAGLLATGAVAMLFVAGLVEGIFRQEVRDDDVRYAVVMLTALWWAWYFGVGAAGRRAAGGEPA
jgi:uncharacterized membrane protein SpoIIM required for sporulation